MECELCKFNNPKATVTAIIIRDNKILSLKRNEEPFKGYWDFLGGYMQAEETPEEAIEREIEEEIGAVPIDHTFIKTDWGYAYWKNNKFPILSHYFLVDIGSQDIELNKENSEYKWFPIKDLKPEEVAFDSNRKIAQWIKDNFEFDLDRVKELIKQLDPSASFKEQYLYKAFLNGYISKVYDKDKLIGLGCIFPRNTFLRRQAVIEDMIVDEIYRGKGYGKAIVLDLINWAKENEMDTIELTTNSKRIAANELYKSVGFWHHITNHYLYNVNRT